MANQLKMAQVHTIQNLSARGRSKRSIALELGIHRDTVTRHLEGDVHRQRDGQKTPLGPLRRK